MLHSTTTTSSLSGIRFAYNQLGNHTTFKLRFTRANAERFLDLLPKHFHNQLMILITLKGHVIIACIAHSNSSIWNAIEQARIDGKIKGLLNAITELEHIRPATIARVNQAFVPSFDDTDELPF